MAKTVKIKWDKNTKKPKSDKKDDRVKVQDDGTVVLTVDGINTVIPVETWNHGAGWNSITLDFDE